MPVDADQHAIVRDAWRRFGKGRHPAALNFGDCFSYALSVVTQEPPLFKGDDFARTDVLRVALLERTPNRKAGVSAGLRFDPVCR